MEKFVNYWQPKEYIYEVSVEKEQDTESNNNHFRVNKNGFINKIEIQKEN